LKLSKIISPRIKRLESNYQEGNVGEKRIENEAKAILKNI
jgi:hypothetical protein